MTTFYLKYRPQKIDDLDIASVRDTLNKIVSSGKIPHAILFSGPKGTGKTSAARIVAKVINCEENEKKLGDPCGKCDQCLSIEKGNNIDVIELDAASHRGIDDARALIDAVKLSPARARKKVYIIDEAHMLTTEASNALLKTLEEPPAHVVFILATTNPEKLIETIRSRTTNITFSKASLEEVVHSLGKVAKGEGIKVGDDALLEIAKAAKGAFRDAAKIFEQLVVEEKSLELDSVKEYLFKNKSLDTQKFIDLLISREDSQILSEISRITSLGISASYLTESILTELRKILLSKVGLGNDDYKKISKSELVSLIDLLSDSAKKLKDAFIEELPLELAIIKWCNLGDKNVGVEIDEKKEVTAPVAQKVEEIKIKTEEVGEDKVSMETSLLTGEIGDDVWKTILSKVRPVNASIEALLRASKPMGYDGKCLTLGVYYKFHKERLEETRNRKIFEEVVAAVIGAPIRVNCMLTDPPPKPVVSDAVVEPDIVSDKKENDLVSAAEEIFGN